MFNDEKKQMKQDSKEMLKKLQIQFDDERKKFRAEIEDLRSQIKNDENEAIIASLNERINELLTVYLPSKGDSTDEALANFINKFPEREQMKIMFLRESEGVYQFGSKRVYIKVDCNQVLVRVGGGFIHVKDFMQKFTPIELEKIQRRDALSRFKSKLQVQTFATFDAFSSVETLPITFEQ